MSESMSQLIGRKRKRNQIDDDTKDERSPNAGDMIMDSNDADVNTGTEVEFSKEYLQIYYDKLFPYQAFFDWLSYFNGIYIDILLYCFIMFLCVFVCLIKPLIYVYI